MDPARRGLALIVVSAVSFGGVAVLTKLALAGGLGVLALSFWRWAFAAAALAPVVALSRGLRLPPRSAAAAFGLGLVGQCATSGLYTAALATVPAGLGSFLLYLNPVFVALLAWAVLRERLSARGWGAMALALGGLALLALGPGVAADPLGVAMALAAAGCYAGTITAGRSLVAREDPLRVAAHLMAGAAAGFGLAAAATGTWAWPSEGAWPVLLLLGVGCTALSVATFYLALPLLGAPRAALVSTLEPVSTLGIAYLVLGEVLAAVQLLGAGLVLLAVAALALEPRRAPSPAGGPGAPSGPDPTVSEP